MIEQQTIEEIKLLLDQESYENAIAFLEKCIEEDPDELTYYWYLGLAYLLTEQEDNARLTWVLIMSQGNEGEVEQWTQALLIILKTEAQQQEQIKNLKKSWLIRRYIR